MHPLFTPYYTVPAAHSRSDVAVWHADGVGAREAALSPVELAASGSR